MRVSKVLATILLGFVVVEAANNDQSQGGRDSKDVSTDNNNGAGSANQKQTQEGDSGSQQGQDQGNQQGGKAKGQQSQGQQNQNQKGGNKNSGDNNNADNGQNAQQNVTQGLQPLPGKPEAAQQLQPLPGLASAQQSLKPLPGAQANATAAQALKPLGGNTAPPPPGTASSSIDLAQLTAIANSVNGAGAAAATAGMFSNGTSPAAAPMAEPQRGGLQQLPGAAAASRPSITPAAFMTIPGGGEAMATATPPAETLPGAVAPPQAANLEPLPGTVSSDASLMALAPQTMTTMTITVAGADGATVLATMTAPANATAAAARNGTASAGTVQVAGAPSSKSSGTTGVVVVLSGVLGLLGYLMG